MSAATRRDFLGGALAGAALPLLGSADSEAATTVPQAKQRVVRRGRAIAASPDGRRLVIAHDLHRTIGIVTRGRRYPRVVDVGGQPVAVAIAPDGAHAAVVTASWDHPRVVLVELATGRVGARRKLGPAPTDLAFTPDGRRLLVVGGEQEGTLHVLDAGRLTTLERVAVGRVPRAVAVTPGAGLAWVTVQADDRVVAVDVIDGRILRELRTPALPDRVAVSPDGTRLLLTHGGRDDQVTEIDLAGGRRRRHAAGRHPSAVAFTRGGHRLVALGGESAVLRLEGKRRRAVGPAPRGLAVAGRRFFTVSALTGATSGGRL